MAAATVAVLAMAAMPPALPVDFYTGLQGLIVQYQGSYTAKSGGGLCCAKDSRGCQVTSQSMGADYFQQGSRNRSIQRGADGITMTWAAPVHKVMTLQPGSAVNSTHTWACAAYCDHKTPFVSKVAIGGYQKDPVTYAGHATVAQPAAVGGATRRCDGYGWTERLMRVFPVSNVVMYVDREGAQPAPWKQVSRLTQFVTSKLHEANSTMNMSFVGFDASADLASHFDIDMGSVASCPEASKAKVECPEPHSSRGAERAAHRSAPMSRLEMAAERLAAMGPAERAAAEARHRAKERQAASGWAGKAPIFPSSYTAHVQYATHIAQGNTVSATGDGCCPPEAPMCQLVVQHSSATKYLDTPSQTIRTEDDDGHVVISDFKTRRSMLVNVTAGVETCQEYCPIPHLFPPPAGFALPNSTVDRGATTLDGRPVEEYQWSETMLKVITMSTTSLYASLAANGSAVPIFQTRAETPLGMPAIGTSNMTWTRFEGGRPPAAKMRVAGADTCKQSKRCKGPGPLQTHRLLTGQARAWDEVRAWRV